MTTTTTTARPVAVQSFRTDALFFESDGDMPIKLNGFTSSIEWKGAVVAILDVDGEKFDEVFVDGRAASVEQLTDAITALERARDALRQLHSGELAPASLFEGA